MKRIIVIIGAFLLLVACSNKEQQKPLENVIDDALMFAQEQSLLMARECVYQQNKLPRTFENGKVLTVGSEDWTSGFFPGVLWYLYDNSRDMDVLNYARQYTIRLKKEQFTISNHDIGFILYCSFGNGWRIEKDTTYRDILLNGAESLSTRFDKDVGLIRSWDFKKDLWQYPVIIDNMMNLELLMWAAKESKNSIFKDIAVSHATKTMKNHYRPDYSCFHVVSYDTITGTPEIKQTFQGYSDESSWARGQAWGLYGYTMMYRETNNPDFLLQAQHIASYLIHHPNMPEDYIPYWDFNAPDIPDALRDASAAAVMASALIELSSFVDKEQSALYLKIAEKQLRSLSSPEYLSEFGKNGGFILKHSVGFLSQNSEVDVPLNYADYYYVEALTRMKRQIKNNQSHN